MFRYVETYGVPLEFIIDIFDRENLVIDWIDFIEKSHRCGWTIKTTLSKIESSLIDTKGKEYTQEVLLRLKLHIGHSPNFRGK